MHCSAIQGVAQGSLPSQARVASICLTFSFASATLDTGGCLGLTRRGLSPRKRCRAYPGALPVRVQTSEIWGRPLLERRGLPEPVHQELLGILTSCLGYIHDPLRATSQYLVREEVLIAAPWESSGSLGLRIRLGGTVTDLLLWCFITGLRTGSLSPSEGRVLG